MEWSHEATSNGPKLQLAFDNSLIRVGNFKVFVSNRASGSVIIEPHVYRVESVVVATLRNVTDTAIEIFLFRNIFPKVVVGAHSFVRASTIVQDRHSKFFKHSKDHIVFGVSKIRST